MLLTGLQENRGPCAPPETITRFACCVQVWRPNLEFPNSKSVSIAPEELNVWQDGFSLYVGRVQLSLHADLDVTSFPFDSHDLTMTVEGM